MRPHHPHHRLNSVELRLRLDPQPAGLSTVLRVAGRSDTRRADLWTYEESFAPDDYSSKGYGPSDAMAHIALVCIQDQPNTLSRLHFALNGGLGWEQQHLF